MEKLKCFLEKNKIEYIENFDMSNISTIRIGGVVRIVVFPKNQNEFEKVIVFFSVQKMYFRVVGNVSNVLFLEKISYPVVVTNKMKDEIEICKNIVTVSAGVLISKLGEVLKKNRLSGIEGLVGIPATIGGAIMCNAGAFGYMISDHLIKVKVFRFGKIFELSAKEIKFGYHYANLTGFIILSATFLFENKDEYDIMNLCNEFTYLRNKSQPNGWSLGSVYKKTNGKSAGFYIERSGLKGLRVGGVIVSKKHSNFFINDKFGSVMDFLRLSSLVEKTVEKQFGVSLVSEIEKVGEKDEIVSRLSYS